MDNKQIEDIFNQTFAGLALFYRDTTLSDNLISKYQIGQILLERGFTDMSYKSAGLAYNTRYLIASSNGKDLSIFNPSSASFGHIVLTSNSYFKVLDIYRIGDKTQILLLEIPENSISFFANTMSNVEEDIVKKGRDDFDLKINSSPIPELQTQEWKERTEFPLGMNEKGEFFYSSDKLNTSTKEESSKQENKPISTHETTPNKPWWKIW